MNPMPCTTSNSTSIVFTTPFDLPADHYFFVPLVGLSQGEFLWLSAPRPVTGGTGPFTPDLQSWIRDANLAPDWLRVGTDIIGTGTYNAAFSLDGQAEPAQTVPEPATLALLGVGALALGATGTRRNPAIR